MVGKFHPRELFDITKSAKWAADVRSGLHGRWVLDSWRKSRLPEAVTLHTECFKLFRKHCGSPDALARLWSWAAMQKPWALRGQKPHLMRRSAPALAGPVYKEVCERLELTDINDKLPLELVREVYAASRGALPLCVAEAVRLAHTIEDLPDASFDLRQLRQLPLPCIMPWTRDGPPPTYSREETAGLPLIRITMDDLGIYEIERFAEGELTPHPREALQKYCYYVVRATSVDNKIAYYMVRDTQRSIS